MDINTFYASHGHVHNILRRSTANQLRTIFEGTLRESEGCSIANGLGKPIARTSSTRADMRMSILSLLQRGKGIEVEFAMEWRMRVWIKMSQKRAHRRSIERRCKLYTSDSCHCSTQRGQTSGCFVKRYHHGGRFDFIHREHRVYSRRGCYAYTICDIGRGKCVWNHCQSRRVGSIITTCF